LISSRASRSAYCRLLTLSVVAEAHSGLAEANGVLSSADSIELLEFGLVDTLQEYGR
jgi:hypothetical protein